MDKFQLSIVLTEILKEYNFVDTIEVIEYTDNRKSNNIYGQFKENNIIYNFSLDYDDNLDITDLSWINK